MEDHANILRNFYNFLVEIGYHSGNKILNSFEKGQDFTSILEREISLDKFINFNQNLIWKYDRSNTFHSFKDYKYFIEHKKPELTESLILIQNFINRINEIIDYIEAITNKNMDEINFQRLTYLKIKNLENEIRNYNPILLDKNEMIKLSSKLNRYRDILGEDWYRSIRKEWGVKENRKWTEELVIKEIKNYSMANEIQVNDSGLYFALQKHRNKLGEEWYQSATSHFVFKSDEREKEYKENEFKPKLESLLLSYNIQYELIPEYKAPRRDTNKGNYIDFLLTINIGEEFENIVIPIEIKHDESYWKDSDVSSQISRYDRSMRGRKGFHGTYLVSPEGTYGFSEKEFFQIIEKIITENELLLPNSLEWFKEQRED